MTTTGNPFTAFMSEADAQSRALLGVAGTLSRGRVQYASVQLICAPAMEQMIYLSGGAEYQVKLTATVRKDELEEQPKQGDLVAVNGETYHVAGISTTGADPLWTLQLAMSL